MYILYVRHGQSTANFLQMTDPFYFFKLPWYPDAKLSETGVEQASIMSYNIINMLKLKGLNIVPFIFSSILSRSIETANIISKVNENILLRPVVIPYIEEVPLNYYVKNIPIISYINIDLQNVPRNLYDILAETIANNDKSNLKFDIIPELNPYDKNGSVVSTTDIPKFYQSLDLIRKFISESGYKLNDKSVIIIVSHRKTIQEITGLSVGNLGLVLQKDVYDNEILFDGF